MNKSTIANIIFDDVLEAQRHKDSKDGIDVIAQKINNSYEKSEIIDFLISELLNDVYDIKQYSLAILQELKKINFNLQKKLVLSFNKAILNEDLDFIEDYITTFLLLKIKDSNFICLPYLKNKKILKETEFYLLVLYHNIDEKLASIMLANYIIDNKNKFFIPLEKNCINHWISYLLAFIDLNNEKYLSNLLKNISEKDIDYSLIFDNYIKEHQRRKKIYRI